MYDHVFIKLFLSEDTTNVGCCIKVCDGYELIACKTNHDHTIPYDSPLYTPGPRCNVDADCTIPGYHTCDATVGLCDFKSHVQLKNETRNTCGNIREVYIEQKKEQCGVGYNTGSYMSKLEREWIVYMANYYRQLVNNNCDFGKGRVKAVTNYRKVKYSCALEEEAKFDCDSVKLKSDEYILRVNTSIPSWYRKAIFVAISPWIEHMYIDPDSQKVGTKRSNHMAYVRLMLAPEVTQIGCYLRLCNGYEHLACLTGYPVMKPPNVPLYKPGNRCMADGDCTLPGYGICDYETGLCEES